MSWYHFGLFLHIVCAFEVHDAPEFFSSRQPSLSYLRKLPRINYYIPGSFNLSLSAFDLIISWVNFSGDHLCSTQSSCCSSAIWSEREWYTRREPCRGWAPGSWSLSSPHTRNLQGEGPPRVQQHDPSFSTVDRRLKRVFAVHFKFTGLFSVLNCVFTALFKFNIATWASMRSSVIEASLEFWIYIYWDQSMHLCSWMAIVIDTSDTFAG